jgi:hypothetical protein
MTLGRKHYVTYFAPRFRNNQCEISGVNVKSVGSTLYLIVIQQLLHRPLRPGAFRFGMTEIALYHALGKLPEPKLTHDFY